MIYRTLEDLQRQDERTQRITPFGLGMTHMLTPEATVAYLQDVLAGTDLVEAVPESTRLSFERVRTTFIYGALDYDLFTVAEALARVVTEHALRDRFLAYYDGNIPFTNDRGAERVEQARSYEDVMNILNKPGIKPRKGRPIEWRLKLPRSGEAIVFNGMLANLWTWARKEGLLPGHWARRLQPAQVALRNIVAHPSGYHVTCPVDAARVIRDVAEVINCLWGTRTPGGRLHPAPVRRVVLAVAWDADRIAVSDVSSLASTGITADGTCILVRAVPDDLGDLLQFDAPFETTRYPIDLLWGPGALADARAWYEAHQPVEDDIDPLDRPFLIQHRAGRLEPPRRPTIAAALADEDRDGIWYIVRADDPASAYNHVQQIIANDPECTGTGPCARCAAESVGNGTWQQAMALLSSAGIDIQPQHTADIRVPSPLPRWG
jgi:hypothetical protein